MAKNFIDYEVEAFYFVMLHSHVKCHDLFSGSEAGCEVREWIDRVGAWLLENANRVSILFPKGNRIWDGENYGGLKECHLEWSVG